MNWHSTAYVNKLAAFRKLLALNLKASCLFMWAVKKCLHLKKQLISFTGFLKRRREMKTHYSTRKLHNYYKSTTVDSQKTLSHEVQTKLVLLGNEICCKAFLCFFLKVSLLSEGCSLKH